MSHQNAVSSLFRYFILSLLALAPLSVSPVANSAAAEDTGVTLIYPENEAVDLGMGWNLHKNKSVPNVCIQNFTKYDVNKNEKEESFHEGNNSFSLKESLDVSYSESVSEEASGMGAEEHASQSGQMSLSQSFDQTQDDRYVLAKQHIITKWTSIRSSGGNLIELTKSAKNLLATDPDAFHAQCGHGYVARVEYGGSFYGLFNMHTSSYTTAQSFKASFQESAGAKVNEGVGSGGANESSSGSVAASLSATVKNESIDITVLETGGEASSAGTNMESVLEQYASFPVRAANAPSEFRLVVFPYPKSNGLAQSQGPLMALGREYGKWEYLARTIGKMIMDEHTGKESRYTEIKGVTASAADLAEMQNMAQAKLDRISNVAGTCMKFIKQDGAQTQSEFDKNCTLKVTKNIADKSKDPNRVKFKSGWIPVAESDIYYLVRLPFQHKVFDGLLKIQANQSGSYSYHDLIFNQVMGIYKERCGNKEIHRFCENEAKTEAAIKKYVANANGRLYFKLQTLGGSQSLCLSADRGSSAKMKTCDSNEGTMAFSFDHDNKVIRLANQQSQTPTGCLQFYRNNKHKTYQLFYRNAACPAKGANVVNAHFAYFNLDRPDANSPSTFRLTDMNAYYTNKSKLDGMDCLTVDYLQDEAGTNVVSWECHERDDAKKDPKYWFGYWKLAEPQFIVDGS